MEEKIIKQQNIDDVTLSYLKFQTPEVNKKNIIVFFTMFLYFTGIMPRDIRRAIGRKRKNNLFLCGRLL